MRYLKIIVLLGNVLGMTVLIGLMTNGPSDSWDTVQRLFALVWFILVTIVVAFSEPSDTSWLGLYLKRKGLEEQKRIEALEKDNRQSGNSQTGPNARG